MAHPLGQNDAVTAFDAQGPATFELAQVQGCAVLSAAGEIDLYTAPALRDALVAAAESSSRIVIDLSRVTFLDSTGLGVMLGALGRARSVQRSVALVGPTSMVRRVLEITRLNQVFPTYGELDEALAARPGSELQHLPG